MKTETTTIKNKAIFSDDGKHRLLFSREWDKNKKSAMIIMINPNSADTLSMDLTTMLVLNNLNKLGFGSVNIVNLYSRITDKLNLRFNSDEDLLDSENDSIISKYAEQSDVVIIAWGSIGSNSQRVRDRQTELLGILKPYADNLYKIGDSGYHPLTPAVRNEWELVPYKTEVRNNDENNHS